ncbi:MAG: hypothetical protein JXA96_05990 [Sedimentisphaerales bacterium]|nr:hypothetical protein [Sedimentisphaerales bacterium]
MLIRKEISILLYTLFFMTIQVAADETDSNLLNKLSPEVVAAMEGNQKNLDSIKTMQAGVKTITKYDYGDEGSYELIETQRIIYDCNHFRIDKLETKFIGDEKYKNHGSEQGTIDIDSKESNIDYYPSNDHVFIRPPEWSNSYKIRNNPLLKYQSARNATLKNNIMLSAKNGFFFTAQSDKVDGEECILLQCDYTNPDAILKIWVVPSKGYCIKKIEDIVNGSISEEYTTILKKHPQGFWWFDSVETKTISSILTANTSLSVSSITLNEQIDPELFSVWGMGLSSKTRIYDEIQNTNYTLAIDEEDN